MRLYTKEQASSEFEIDSSELPLLRIVFPPVGGNEAVDRVKEKMLAIAAGTQVALCADVRPMVIQSATPKRRNHFYKSVDEFDEKCSQNVVALAVVLSSWVEQHFFQAFIWMKKSKRYPVRAFRTQGDAEAWLARRLNGSSPSCIAELSDVHSRAS